MSNQVTLTLSDTELKKLSRLQKFISYPRTLDFYSMSVKLKTEEITKEKIIHSLLTNAIDEIEDKLNIESIPYVQNIPYNLPGVQK